MWNPPNDVFEPLWFLVKGFLTAKLDNTHEEMGKVRKEGSIQERI